MLVWVDLEAGCMLLGGRFGVVSRQTLSHLSSVRHDSSPLVHSE